MRVCLRLSQEVLDFFDLGNSVFNNYSNRPNGTTRLRYDIETLSLIPLGRSICLKRGYTLVRLKTLKELMLLPTDEVRQIYLDSIKTKRK